LVTELGRTNREEKKVRTNGDTRKAKKKERQEKKGGVYPPVVYGVKGGTRKTGQKMNKEGKKGAEWHRGKGCAWGETETGKEE